jgi:hypothetical protein
MRSSPALFATTLALLLIARPSWAEPQVNVGVRAGVAGVGNSAWWSSTRFHVGAHGDVLFGRQCNASFGAGPYAEVLTNWGDLQTGGGASLLLPIHSYLPLVVSAGGYARNAKGLGWEPGATAEIFWGARSYNYTSTYVMAGGLVLQARQGFGDSKERSVVIAVHLDGEVLALPFVLLYEAISGGRAK